MAMMSPDQMMMLREIMAGKDQAGQNQVPAPLPMEQGGGRPFAPEDITGVRTTDVTGEQEAAMQSLEQVIQQLLATIQIMPPWGQFLNEALAVIHKGLGQAAKTALNPKLTSPAVTPGMMGGMMGNSGMGQAQSPLG